MDELGFFRKDYPDLDDAMKVTDKGEWLQIKDSHYYHAARWEDGEISEFCGGPVGNDQTPKWVLKLMKKQGLLI